MNKKYLFLLFALTLIGAFLRFYKLDWGEGFFFHPDERNIASAVLNLDPVAGDFNPNFFAYGSFPIYVTYVIGTLLTFLTKTNWLEFGRIILIGRAISATLSTLLIPLVYLVFQQLKDKKVKSSELWGIVTAALTAFTPGLIQYAHFSTFEIILTFEYLLALYFTLKIARDDRWRDYIFCAVVLGVSVATKVTSLLILPVLPLAHFVHWSDQLQQNAYDRSNFVTKIYLKVKQSFLQFLNERSKIVAALFLTILTAIILSPYNILDISSFRSSMDYEGGVATSSLPVFYTAQFIGTVPVWYQLTQVFPYILGWPLTIIGFLAFLFLLLSNLSGLRNLLLLIVPALYFVFHAALFVKWTRYMIPMLPFLIIISTVALRWLAPPTCLRRQGKNPSGFLFLTRRVGELAARTLMISLIFVTALQGLNFFSIYLRPDTRVAAAKWASKNIPRDAKILSEVWDMGLIAFNPYFENIELFNFYELDSRMDVNDLRINANDNPKVDELTRLLEQSEYIIVPSQRIYATRLRLPEKFPIGARYYQSLLGGTLGFTKIAEFDLSAIFNPSGFSLPASGGLTRRVGFEETFKVFDHPKVMIFKKVSPMSQTQYLGLLLR